VTPKSPGESRFGKNAHPKAAEEIIDALECDRDAMEAGLARIMTEPGQEEQRITMDQVSIFGRQFIIEASANPLLWIRKLL